MTVRPFARGCMLGVGGWNPSDWIPGSMSLNAEKDVAEKPVSETLQPLSFFKPLR
jgi:hypothetical protein